MVQLNACFVSRHLINSTLSITFIRIKCYYMSGHFKKTISGIIDACLAIAIFLIITELLPAKMVSKLDGAYKPALLIYLLLAIYRLITLLLLKSTVGMHIARIELLNAEEKPLSVKENFCAAFFILINGVDYYETKPSA